MSYNYHTPKRGGIRRMLRKSGILLCTLIFFISFTAYGCKNSDSSNNPTSDSSSSFASIPDSKSLFTRLESSDMFTERDLSADYDETTATKITLSDNASTSTDTSSVSIVDNTITITKEGTYIISGSLSDGYIIVDADSAKVQLVLSNASISCDTISAIYVRNADKTFITLADGTNNSLSTTSDFVAIDENSIDGVIFSKDDLTLNGNGNLTINSSYGHGIVSKDDLCITGGTYEIKAASHAISGKDSVRISDGTFTINATKDGIHSENEEDTSRGFIYISGGTFNISVESDGLDASGIVQIENGDLSITSGDDGIHSDSYLLITNGKVNIPSCYEGLEGMVILIEGGDISVKSSDDGLNAAQKTTVQNTSASENNSAQNGPMQNEFESNDNCIIYISGGKLSVNSDGDGIDSNGNLYVTGGETYVNGPTNDGNGPLDYNGTAIISGGTFVAVGSSGMAQNFSDNSTQGAILVNNASYQNESTDITLKDSDGKTIITYTPEKKYSSVLISTPDIKTGSNYTLTVGDTDTSIQMDSIIYGAGNGSFGGRGNAGGDQKNPGGQQNPGGSQPPDGSPKQQGSGNKNAPDTSNRDSNAAPPDINNQNGNLTPPDMNNQNENMTPPDNQENNNNTQ